MFLKKLVIDNVRSMEHLELDFLAGDGTPRQWTLLLGENGAGKTTILRAIALALAGSDALPEILVNSEDWVRHGSETASITLDLTTKYGEARHIELRLRRGAALAETFAENRQSLAELDNAVSRYNENYFVIGYGVSRRLQSARAATFANPEVMRQPRAQRVSTLFSSDASLRSLEAWAMQLDYQKPEEAQQILHHTFAGMLPGIEFERIDKERRQLLFQTPDGLLPLDLLSDGYQNIISWCGDLLARIMDTFREDRDPLRRRGLLLIDEIDLHLHPLWQRCLMEFLQRKLPNFQILATTHSPLTAHQASEGELYVLRRPNPTAAARLEAFAGDPRKLLLHQFLLSPAFGLQTADSRYVEELKLEHDELLRQPRQTVSEQRRQHELAEELAEAPEWQLHSVQAEERLALLAEIRDELGSRRR
jgi:predicted ATP-binding protein involved in virulence